MAYVIGLVHGGGDAYGISYPDFPGCVAGGASIDDAVSRGEDALAVHVESMLEDGEELPTLRSRDAILSDPQLQDDVKDAVLVAVPMPSARRARVHVMIDESLLAAVERSAEAEGFTRSGYFERAVRDRLMRRAASEENSVCLGQAAFLAHPVAVANMQSTGAASTQMQASPTPVQAGPVHTENAWGSRLREIVARNAQSETYVSGLGHRISDVLDSASWGSAAQSAATILCSSCNTLPGASWSGHEIVWLMQPVATENQFRKPVRSATLPKGSSSNKVFSK